VRVRRAIALAVVLFALSGCTPEWWIEHNFGPATDAAVRVARCESNLNPAAVSPGGGNHGLFQINNVHAATFEAVTGAPWASGRYDAGKNAQFARWLYDSSGWGPWTCKP